MKNTLKTIIVAGICLAATAAAQSRHESASKLTVSASGNLTARHEESDIEFEAGRVSLKARSHGAEFGFRLREVRTAGNSAPLTYDRLRAIPRRSGDSVLYPHFAGVQESYQVTAEGLTQVFHFEADLEGEEGGAVRIVGDVDGNVRSEPGHSVGEVTFLSGLDPVVAYGPARAIDAAGNETPVEIGIDGNELSFEVSGGWLKTAAHPVRIESQIRPLAMRSLTRLPPPPPSIEDMPVWRVQLRLTTSSVANGGTGDYVRVSLNSNNQTFLDWATNDFERGSTVYYELPLTGIKTLKDITNIFITKGGTDGWCLQSMALYVNNLRIYSADLGTGQWLDGDHGYKVVAYINLRTNADWTAYRAPNLPTLIYGHELKFAVMTAHGDAMTVYAGLYKWGGMGSSKIEYNNLSISYDRVRDYYFDQHIQSTATMQVTCSGGVMGWPEMQRTRVDESENQNLTNVTFSRVAEGLQARLAAIQQYSRRGTACPLMSWQSNGNLAITYQ